MQIENGTYIGRYLVQKPLGRGGMAEVYLAFDTRLERMVAIKMVRPDVVSRKEIFKKRFMREARALGALNHEAIVQVLDYGEYQGNPYLVMAYIPGETLKEFIIERKRFTPQEAVRILLPIAQGLAFAHRKHIIHRDVKPSNILVTPQEQLFLTDFGIAKLLGDEVETMDLTGVNVGVGTPEYMAPEQGLGKMVDGRADVYSLGVIFYEMLVGRKPYQGDTPVAILHQHITAPLPDPRQVNPGISQAALQILFKALAKDPAARYQSMDDLVQDLQTILEQQEKPLSGMALARRKLGVWLKSRRRWGYSLAVPSLALVVFLGLNVFRGVFSEEDFKTTSTLSETASIPSQEQEMEPERLDMEDIISPTPSPPVSGTSDSTATPSQPTPTPISLEAHEQYLRSHADYYTFYIEPQEGLDVQLFYEINPGTISAADGLASENLNYSVNQVLFSSILEEAQNPPAALTASGPPGSSLNLVTKSTFAPSQPGSVGYWLSGLRLPLYPGVYTLNTTEKMQFELLNIPSRQLLAKPILHIDDTGVLGGVDIAWYLVERGEIKPVQVFAIGEVVDSITLTIMGRGAICNGDPAKNEKFVSETYPVIEDQMEEIYFAIACSDQYLEDMTQMNIEYLDRNQSGIFSLVWKVNR